MITFGDLQTKSKMKPTMFLDMAKGAYQNTYQSETYPRLQVVKRAGARASTGDQVHWTEYFVDGIECADLEAVIRMLNTEPHPQREDLARHLREMENGEDT